jgi:hypothetical protein
MRTILSIILVGISLSIYGQKGRFTPFRLLVIKTDTAIIDKSLVGDIDSLESVLSMTTINRFKD